MQGDGIFSWSCSKTPLPERERVGVRVEHSDRGSPLTHPSPLRGEGAPPFSLSGGEEAVPSVSFEAPSPFQGEGWGEGCAPYCCRVLRRSLSTSTTTAKISKAPVTRFCQ